MRCENVSGCVASFVQSYLYSFTFFYKNEFDFLQESVEFEKVDCSQLENRKTNAILKSEPREENEKSKPTKATAGRVAHWARVGGN